MARGCLYVLLWKHTWQKKSHRGAFLFLFGAEAMLACGKPQKRIEWLVCRRGVAPGRKETATEWSRPVMGARTASAEAGVCPCGDGSSLASQVFPFDVQ